MSLLHGNDQAGTGRPRLRRILVPARGSRGRDDLGVPTIVPNMPETWTRRLALAAVAGAALVVCLVVLRPLDPATIDVDASASVLYFRQIVTGDRLDVLVPTTPKPLLTLIYGISWQLLGDWRVLTWETIAAFVVAVTLAARLAARLAGPAAAAFLVVSLLAWPELLRQVAHANGFPWALALWLAAATAISAPRRSSWLSGLALFAAGLARIETIWLVVAGAALLVAKVARTDRGSRTAVLMADLPIVGLASLAVPVMCLHDCLLSGMPLYWLGLARSYTAIVYPTLTPVGLSTFWSTILWPRYAAELPLVVLAIVGLGRLAMARRWAMTVGLGALIIGVPATIAVLARQAVYVDSRYWEELDAPLRLAAAVGAAALIGLASARVRAKADRGIRRLVPVASLVIAAGLSLAVAWPGVAASDLGDVLAADRAASIELDAVVGELGPVLRNAAGGTRSVSGVELPVADPTQARLFAPRADLARIAVMTEAPYEALGDNYLAFRTTRPVDLLRPGQWILHLRVADGFNGLDLSTLELDRTTTLGELTLVPDIADRSRGIWLLRVAGP